MLQWRRNLYVLFLIQILSTAAFSLVFPFLPLYVAELGIRTWGSVEFWSGMVFSAQAVTMMLSAPVWGVVADRYGRKLMLVRATLGGAVVLAAMGLAQSAEQLTLLRAVQGVLSGTIAAANALVAGSAPREHSGEALGLMQMGVWVGVAVGPLIGGVIGDLFGFRESFWLTGALLGLAGVAVIFWVQEDFTPPPPQERAGFLNGYRALLRAPSMIGLYSLAFLQSLGQTIILPIAALFVGQLMGPASAVATVTGLLMGTKALAGSLSAVWLGRLSDRVGHRKVLLFSAAAALLVYLPQPFVSAAWQLVVLQGLLGLANGGIIPATNALLNLHSPPGRQGATFGLSTSVNSAARSVAPILGALIAIWFGKRGVFGAAALVYGLLALLSFYIRRAGPPAGSSAGPGARDSISARSSPSSGKATPL